MVGWVLSWDAEHGRPWQPQGFVFAKVAAETAANASTLAPIPSERCPIQVAKPLALGGDFLLANGSGGQLRVSPHRPGSAAQNALKSPYMSNLSPFQPGSGNAQDCPDHRGGGWRQSLPRQDEQLGCVFVQDIRAPAAKTNLTADSGRRLHFAVDHPLAFHLRLDHAPNLCLPEKLNTLRSHPTCPCRSSVRTWRMSSAQA